MNDNFLQEDPLKLFDDFVEIPEEIFENEIDSSELNAVISTLYESEDYARVLSKINNDSSNVLQEQKDRLSSYLNNAENGTYGNGKKKDSIIHFMNRSLSLIDEIQKYGGAFKHTNVKICKVHPDAILPKYKDNGDAGADVYTVKDETFEPGETKLIPLGIKVIVPGGYKLEIVPRSGLSLTTSMTIPNSPGTIDCGYRDEVKVIVHNSSSTEPLHFTKNSRIAQLILVPIVKMDWEELTEEDYNKFSTYRGDGFGSSGIK